MYKSLEIVKGTRKARLCVYVCVLFSPIEDSIESRKNVNKDLNKSDFKVSAKGGG
jgi:hypothetical protein